ncbi:MAG: hypothetical protein WDA10_08305 [Porticoccaceae bacterium]
MNDLSANATLNQAEQDTRERQAITQWIADNIGATVTRIERQRRWRPVWRVEAIKDGAPKPLLVKGTRAWNCIPYPLLHEMKMMEVLEANGIPVPHVHGMCDYPEAFVMDWIEGGRDPGLVMEAVESASTMSPDRWQASLNYMEILARMHKIPAEQFEAAGAPKPRNAEEVALAHVERFNDMCEAANIVDPFMEFCMVWMRRNVPKHRTRCTFVTGDCGQFLNKGPDVTAVLDVEIGHLGDNLHDLACFRGRHPVENMGDLPALFRHYAKHLGEELDLPVLAYHTVAFLAVGYFGPLFALADPQPGGDWVESAVQVAFIGRRCFEALAEIVGVELDEISLPDAHVTPWEDMALDKLLLEINRLPTSENFADWQRNTIASIPRFLINQVHYGRWAEEEDLKEMAAVLGHRPADIKQGDIALRDYVRTAPPAQDAALVKLFHRRLLRQCLVFAGPGAPADHLFFRKVEPILNMEK